MADSDNTRTLPTRRRFLSTAAAVSLAPAAALAAVPLDADMTGPLVADDDAELLALVAEFRTLWAVSEAIGNEHTARRDEAERIYPDERTEDDGLDATHDKLHARWLLVQAHVGEDSFEQATKAHCAAGHKLREVFKVPARTVPGILAKVELWTLAYGTEPLRDAGLGTELDSFDVDNETDWDDVDENGDPQEYDDPDWRPWMQTILDDLRAMAGGAQA